MTVPPPFSSEGIRKVLGPDEASSANAVSQQRRMAALDEAELRDLERAEYYGEAPAAIEDAKPAAGRLKGIFDRLFKR